MTKLKGFIFLLLGALLLDFAVENALPSPALKLIKFDLGKLPIFVLVYGSLGLGFLGGWLGHVLRAKRQRRAALAAEKPESRQAPQEQQQQ